MVKPSPNLFCPGVWWFGVDPGGVDPHQPREPFGVGDVRLGLLLRHDPPVDDHVCCWLPQEQPRLGRCCKSTAQREVKTN